MVVFSIFKIVVFSFLLYLLGYHFVYTIVKKFLRRRKIRTQGERTLATVVDYKITKDSDGVKSFYPILEFKTKTGEVMKVQSLKRRSSKYAEDKHIYIYYLTSDPAKFYITGLVPFVKIAGLALGFLGACALIFEIIKSIRILITGN